MFNGKTSSNGSCSTVHRQKIKFRMVCELLKGGKVLIHMIYIHYSLSYPSILVVISMMSNQYSLKIIRCPSQKCLESLPKTSFFQGRAVKLQGCNLEVAIIFPLQTRLDCPALSRELAPEEVSAQVLRTVRVMVMCYVYLEKTWGCCSTKMIDVEGIFLVSIWDFSIF